MHFRKYSGYEILRACLLGFLVATWATCENSRSDLLTADDHGFARARQRMVRQQIEGRGVRDERVLEAMRSVPRHRFVPEAYRSEAYHDGPLPIGYEQTISQPYIVALMTELLGLQGHEKVLEIGTGCGYQTAVLADLAAHIYSIEIVPELCARARADLSQMGYTNIDIRCGDGFSGWAEAAPFDAILVAAAPSQVPPPLLEQLRVGGVLVIPVGDHQQELVRIRRASDSDFRHERILPVRFVPMTGEAERTH